MGFWIAQKIGGRGSLLLLIVIELTLLVWIKDSLLLNVIMLIHPIDAIKVWQTGH